MELHSGSFGHYIFGDPLDNLVLDFQAEMKIVSEDIKNPWHRLKQSH